MSFFSDSSLFRKVPAAIRDDQRAWFDAVRFTCETAHISFARVNTALGKPELYSEVGTIQLDTDAVLVDAYTFVDAAQRLRKLLGRVGKLFERRPPGTPAVVPKKPPPADGYEAFKLALKVFESKLDGLVDVRNGTQHLDEKIGALGDAKVPVWGTLAWAVVVPFGEKDFDVHYCSILPGYIFNGSKTPTIDRFQPVQEVAGRLKLRAHGRELDLTEIRKAMEPPIEALEAIFKPQFEGLPTMAISFFTQIVATSNPARIGLKPPAVGEAS